jgi:hypothetical protein
MQEAIEQTHGSNSASEQIKKAENAERQNSHGASPLIAGFEGTNVARFETPEEFTGFKVTEPEQFAAGLPAIFRR